MSSIKYIGVFLAAIAGMLVLKGMQQTQSACCTIIDINKDSGAVFIRHHADNWIKWFKPDVLEFAELKIGDSVDASLIIKQVNRIKNEPRSYPLLQPVPGDPSGTILEMKGINGERLVIARNVSGEHVRFKVPDTLATRFQTGQPVFTSATHGFAMLYLPAIQDSSDMIFLGFPLLPENE